MRRWLSPDASRLFGLLRPWRAWMAIGVLLATVAALSAIGLMAVSGWFIAAMALAGASGAVINYYTPAAAIRGFAIARAGGRYGERLATHDATLRALSGLRAWLFCKLIPLAPARLSALRSADLFARLRADVDVLEQFYLSVLVPVIVAAIGSLAVLLLAAAVLPSSVPVLMLAVIASGVVLPLWVQRRAAADAGAVVREAAELRGLLADALRGHAELLAWGGVDAHAGRIAALDARIAARRRRIGRLEAIGGGGATPLAQLTVAALLVPALSAAHGATLAPPLLVMLALLVLALFELITPLAPALAQWQATLTAARRVFELVDAPPAIREPVEPAAVAASPAIRFEGVRLRYATGAPWALDGVDLDLAPGARLAIVGPSGAGKSSLLLALQKFYPLQRGRILFGGEPLDTLRGDDVRRAIAVIAQRNALFDLSLRDNLRLAAPASTAAQIERALHAAQLDAFVAALPRGLDTPLGEGGARVSGGEARRIAIARALLQDAPVLVLDEPTEGLDATTAARLYAALAIAVRGRSVLLVTHRLGQLAALVDRVAVMRAGRIVECMDTATYLRQARGRGILVRDAIAPA
ncbi:MAG: thiol reductant ABC exporter subunit CydC [Rhodanobacteraceae bacterium]|nr:MAG: thiol reductant ABC exporter subunit CydC [Rhodanobacteraceae bacterium]